MYARLRLHPIAFRSALVLGAALLTACVAPPPAGQPAPPPTGADPLLAMAGGALNLAIDSQLPDVDATLPYETTVAPGRSLPIDGIYRLDANQVLYRVDRGRTIADQDYPNFGFTVRRGMVVSKDIQPDGKGGYEGFDLVWQAPVQITPQDNGDIVLQIAGIIPITLRGVRVDTGAAPEPPGSEGFPGGGAPDDCADYLPGEHPGCG